MMTEAAVAVTLSASTAGVHKPSDVMATGLPHPAGLWSPERGSGPLGERPARHGSSPSPSVGSPSRNSSSTNSKGGHPRMRCVFMRCGGCNRTLLIAAKFGTDNTKPSLRKSRCRRCTDAASAQSRLANRAIASERERERRALLRQFGATDTEAPASLAFEQLGQQRARRELAQLGDDGLVLRGQPARKQKQWFDAVAGVHHGVDRALERQANALLGIKPPWFRRSMRTAA